jgi:hypothetical protein
MALVLVAPVAAMAACSDDDDSASAFSVRANAVFCTDLVSARDTVISGVVDDAGRVAPDGVATFAVAYEPILRDHIAGLRSLDAPDPDAVGGVLDAAGEVADRLQAVAADPSTTAATTADDLRALATSPTLVDRLGAAGLRTC